MVHRLLRCPGEALVPSDKAMAQSQWQERKRRRKNGNFFSFFKKKTRRNFVPLLYLEEEN
jgi:hypothetical protein